jgi:hypothetical protein
LAAPLSLLAASGVTLFLLAAGVIVGALGGCGGTSTSSRDDFGQQAVLPPSQDHFSLAMGFFRRFDEFAPAQARRQVLDNLNR